MAPSTEMQTAMVNRSIRTIKAELEFLTDASVITPQTLSDLLSRIPEQTALHAPLSVGAVPSSNAQIGTLQPPVSPLAAMNLAQNNSQTPSNDMNEKAGYYQPQNNAAPPPAYGANNPPQPSFPPLCQATALYAYTSADKGDLELQPNDQIEVTEYLNAEWWKGRSKRTGLEGIFPRSYVRVQDAPPPPTASGSGPEHHGEGGKDNKIPAGVDKFGRKLGNAAIFGAGASIGSRIVGGIF